MKKSQKTISLRAGVAPIVLGLALIAAPAFAQSDTSNQAGASESEDTETIVVTGSRIARNDLVASSPLAVVPSEEFKFSGAVNVEQVINTLPQVLPGATSFSNNPGGGVATLNLRGLGTQRNLVLVNDRRWMFFDTQQVTDLNTIPQFLIKSVEVVTGGASAVYGSDAIAGVVNFRLRNDLKGFEGGTEYALTEKGDGARFNAHIALGAEFADGRGSVTVFGEYYKRKSIFSDARRFSRATVTDDGDGGFLPGGSPTAPAGRFFTPEFTSIDPDGPGPLTAIDLPRGVGNFGSNATTNPLGATFDSPGSASRLFTENDFFNYAPDNYLQVPQERWLLGGYGEYEISDSLKVFTEVSFINNRVDNELAATPVTGNFNFDIASQSQFLSASDIAALQQIDANEAAINAANIARCNTINLANPNAGCTPSLLPGAGVVQLGIGRRIQETGNRISLDDRNAFRVLVGAQGDITNTLHWDAYYSYARTRNANVQQGNISRSAVQAGLNGTANPINLFGPGALTQAMVDQISILAQNNDISQLQVASASVNGSLFNLGMGGSDIGFALGAEWRQQSSRFIPDTALSSGDVIGFNAGEPTGGGYTVKEIFGEINIPIIADRPFFHRLELHGAGRYSDYSLDAVGGVWTYAGDVKWSPIPDITFRGNYQRAVRAPNVGELFGGQQQGFPAATDPCAVAGAQNNATLRALCVATGVPDGAVGTGVALQPAVQIQGVFGGNPNLQEEVSDSYSFGAVIQPSFIPRLNITIDYFNIKVDNAIFPAAGGVAGILDFCYNVIQNAASPVCQAINRDPDGVISGAQAPDGSFYVVEATNANLSTLKTSGVDLQVDYVQPLNFGLLGADSKLSFFFLGTYTKKNSTQPVAGVDEFVECAGLFGAQCGNPQSKYKWTTRLAWMDGPLTSTLRWRHLSATRDDDDSTDYTTERLRAYDLYDLAFSVDISDNLEMSAGVNNLFNKKPQLIGDNQEQANTYPGTFDVLGRDYFISAKLRF